MSLPLRTDREVVEDEVPNIVHHPVLKSSCRIVEEKTAGVGTARVALYAAIGGGDDAGRQITRGHHLIERLHNGFDEGFLILSVTMQPNHERIALGWIEAG